MSKAKGLLDIIEKDDWKVHKTSSVETRKKDLVVRVSNWLRDKDEPGYDVEVYLKGSYHYDESKTFTLSSGLTKDQAKEKAIEYACSQIKKLLK